MKTELLFRRLSKSKSGFVAVKDLAPAVVGAGLIADRAHWQRLLGKIGFVNRDRMNLNEFQVVWCHQLCEDPEAIVEAMRLFDCNGDGFLSVPELREVMQAVEPNIARESVMDLIREGNANNGTFCWRGK